MPKLALFYSKTNPATSHTPVSHVPSGPDQREVCRARPACELRELRRVIDQPVFPLPRFAFERRLSRYRSRSPDSVVSRLLNFSFTMTSKRNLLAKAIKKLCGEARARAEARVETSKLEGMAKDELKRLLPLSLFEIEESGAKSWVSVPRSQAVKFVKAADDTETAQVKVSRDGKPIGAFEDWSVFVAKVRTVYWGVLTEGPHEGANAGSLNIGAIHVQLRTVTDAVPMVQLRCGAAGASDPAAQAPQALADALQAAGAVGDIVHATGSAPVVVDPDATMLSAVQLALGDTTTDDAA